MKKLLLLGSVASPCPPKKQGGTERVAYYQAKYLAKKGVKIIFVGALGTIKNFKEELEFEKESQKEKILSQIEFIEIGGGTQFGQVSDSISIDLKRQEASRKLRLENTYLARVIKLMIERHQDYEIILNNLRGEAVLLPIAQMLNKKFIHVCHLNIFLELADLFKEYQTQLITISNSQRTDYSDLNYLATIYNPINTKIFSFNSKPKNYALMISTIGYHKNQKDAILACQKAKIPLILAAGKIRDLEYFNQEIKPFIDNKNVIYYGDLDFSDKLKLYQEAKVFLFPILWNEPFGLVCIEALSCGTPVIAYPHGGPKEIIINGDNGFLVDSVNEMVDGIKHIDEIKRENCRKNVEERFAEEVIGEQYYQVLNRLFF